MNIYGVIAALAIGLILIVIYGSILVYAQRKRSFKPTENKQVQLEKVNNVLKPFGFEYNPESDLFYALKDCPQRKFGYLKSYDDGAAFFNMIMDCEPITFFYGNKQWLIEFWKGQYGITTGAEVGIYNADITDEEQDYSNTHYKSITDDELLPISLTLFKNGRELFKRNSKHWWQTGFLLGEFSEKDELSMNVRIKFPNIRMRSAFVNALFNAGYKDKEICIMGTSVSVKYSIPKTSQPITQTGVQMQLVQQINKNNCKLYNNICKKYDNTLDRIEYIEAMEPGLFEVILGSLHQIGFYEED